MEVIKKALERKTHEFRRLVQKAYIEMHRRTRVPKSPKAPYYNECIEICRRMLSDRDTILLIAPISSKRYMKNEKFGIYVIFNGRTVEVINHVYNYTVPVDDETWEKMMDDFNQELEDRKEEFEDEIAKNIKYSLKTILKTMTKKDEEQSK